MLTIGAIIHTAYVGQGVLQVDTPVEFVGEGLAESLASGALVGAAIGTVLGVVAVALIIRGYKKRRQHELGINDDGGEEHSVG